MHSCYGDHCDINLLVEVRVLASSGPQNLGIILVTNGPRKRRAGKDSFDVPGNVSQSAAVYEKPDTAC